MATATLFEQLHQVLFPGVTYTDDRDTELAKKLHEVAESISGAHAETKPRRGRGVDFDKYQQRYVALQFLYLGHDYHGFARQEGIAKTIEESLFNALKKLCLVPEDKSWQELRYSRGGRTDKGVSALGQVVALYLRSAGKAGEPLLPEDQEIDYPTILNRVLPAEIKILGWTTVPDDFSARFSAQYREYKYFIVTRPEDLDIDKMREAAQYLLGEHDFRHFCKVDVVAVRTFVRSIFEVKLEDIGGTEYSSSRRVLQLYIKGSAFLWHQIRCIAAILLLVGRGQEDPVVVKELLNIEKNPRKPIYPIASDEPLLLFNCSYPGLSFRRSQKAYYDVLKCLDKFATRDLTRAALIGAMEEKLDLDDTDVGQGNGKRVCFWDSGKYIPLFKRATEPSVEERKTILKAKGVSC